MRWPPKVATAVGTLGRLGYITLFPAELIASLLGVALWFATVELISAGLVAQLALLAVLLVIAGWACALHCRRPSVGLDPSEIIVDETCGMVTALIGLPPHVFVLGAAWVLFHVFDVKKPFPVRPMERVPGVTGVFLDDLTAGLCANVVLRLALLVVRL